jgi:hypothetical protein
MQLLGDWNWYFPRWSARLLFTEPEPAPVD